MARRSESALRKKLRLWTLAMLGGMAALAAAVWWLDRWRDSDRASDRTGVSAAFRDAAVARASPVRFTEVTAQSGIRRPDPGAPRRRALPEDNGSGLAWGDYDGDGWPDLYVVSHQGRNQLYHNNRDGTFTDLAERAGVADSGGFGMGASWADYDGDGRLDLYVTNRGPNRLFHNNGDGTFTDLAGPAGVADAGWSTGVAWGDFDRDGRLDLYVCNYVRYDSDGLEPAVPEHPDPAAYEAPYTLNPNSYDPQPNHLYRNRGDGTFEDVTGRAGVADPDGRSLAATFVDLDGDGWLDLYVTNDVSPDRLYRNLGGEPGAAGGAAFLDYSAMAGTADPRGSMGLSVTEVGDLDGAGDGLPDLFITHWVAQENALYQSVVMAPGQLEYRDKARQFGLGEISIDRVGWGCAFVDLDLDGRVDLATVNGSTLEQPERPQLLKPEPMFLFISGGGAFHDVAPLAGPATARRYNARGLAAADFDNDGDIDLALSTNEGEVHLLRNDTPTPNRSLKIRLNGPAPACFGAKVEVWAGGRRQIRWCGADVSYLSQHAPEAVFGLGPASGAERVRIQWVDGKVSEISPAPAGPLDAHHPAAGEGGRAGARP